MAEDLIHDRGRGPEIIGTRVTVYNLLPYFLDPSATEARVSCLYQLTPEQVAAARAYVLNNADVVLAEHLKIEERLSTGNPSEVIEAARRTHERLLAFKKWLREREQSEADELHADPCPSESSTRPTFPEWLASGNAGETAKR
jgi:uncharacterized protein (DUF433 family)